MPPKLDRPLTLSPDMVWEILRACGISHQSFRYLTAGATSEVWDISTRDGRLVLRVAAPRAGESARYEAEFAIRSRLLALGGKVARPIATNSDVSIDVGVAWCLDAFVDGAAVANGELTDTHCRELGATLAHLHSLPVEGFGLLRDQREPLAGERHTPVEGLRSRWTSTWPFDGTELAQHPLTDLDSDLARRTEQRRELILGAGNNQPVTVCHTDLHGGQIPSDGRGLAAVLDFGDAIAGWPLGDIASFRFFHGRERTDRLLEGYGQAARERFKILEQAELLSIMLALHHISRGTGAGVADRVAAGHSYLSRLLV